MIIYATRTGNVKHIVSEVQKLDASIPCVSLRDVKSPIQEPFLLITYTDGLGAAPPVVLTFLSQNSQHCKGAIASGNSNFGHYNFGRAIDVINEQFGIPALHKIDLRGSHKDFQFIVQLYKERIHHA